MAMKAEETRIKPVLLTPDMVAVLWSVSIKTIYRLINEGSLPYVSLPSHGKRKRLIRIRAEAAESFIKMHEQNRDETKQGLLPTPRRRRRSVLGVPKGVISLQRIENGSGSPDEDTKNA